MADAAEAPPSAAGGHLRHWRSFPAALRLLTALGIAGAAAGLLAESLAGPAGRVAAAPAQGGFLTVPGLLLPVTAALLCAGWAFVFAGALQGARWVRLAIAAAWLALAWPVLAIGPPFAWLGYAAPPALLLWRGWARRWRAYGPGEFLVFAAAVAVLEVAALGTASPGPGIPAPAAFVLTDQLVLLTYVCFPLLVLAGMDLAEVAVSAGDWATRRLERLGGKHLAWLLLGLSLAKAGYLVLGGVFLSPRLVLSLLALAALGLAAARLPRGHALERPPFRLLVGVLAVALLAPVGGALLAGLLPRAVALGLAGALPFALGALVAGTAVWVGRRAIERRWPGASSALLVVAVWSAWLVAAGAHPAWGLSDRGIELSLAAGCVALVIAARGRDDPWRGLILLGLEATVVLTVMRAIQVAYGGHWDVAGLYTGVQAALIVGTAAWLWLSRRVADTRRLRLRFILLGAAVLAVGLGLAFGVGTAVLVRAQLLLIVLALVWEAARAEGRLRGVLGADVPPGAATCLHVGFVLLLTAVLGWMQALAPRLPEASYLSNLPAFGLAAVGLPIVLLWQAGRAYPPRSVTPGGAA